MHIYICQYSSTFAVLYTFLRYNEMHKASSYSIWAVFGHYTIVVFKYYHKWEKSNLISVF